MIKKTAVMFSVFLYTIVVPFLDINETHVWNPDWTPHVRIHEVWELITNSSIGVLGFGVAFLFLIFSHVLIKNKKTTS